MKEKSQIFFEIVIVRPLPPLSTGAISDFGQRAVMSRPYVLFKKQVTVLAFLYYLKEKVAC